MTISAPQSAGPRFAATLALIALAALAVRAWGLSSDPPLSDDVLAGASAVNLVERGEIGPTMWQHPRVRDLAVYASTSLLGETKPGFVMPSLLLGLAGVLAAGLLALRLGGPRAGLLAAFLLAFDSLHVGYSREAVQDVYAGALASIGVLLVVEHDRSRRPAWLVAAGVAFALGAASKWSAGFAACAALGWFAVREARRAADVRDAASRVALGVTALAVVPAAVYTLTWTPWLLEGRDLGDLLRLHGAMAGESLAHAGFNPVDLVYSHRAVLWFVTPSVLADFAAGPSGVVPYVFVTNPAVWMLVLPAAIAVGLRAYRKRRSHDALVLAAFAATYVPFVVASRPIWVNAALAVEPFAVVLVAILAELVAARVRWSRGALEVYALVVLVIAAPLTALATGRGWQSRPLRAIVERFRPPAELEGPEHR